MGRASRAKDLRRKQRPECCLGCGVRLPLTREHIVADWIRRALENEAAVEGPGRWVLVSGDAIKSHTQDFARFEIAGYVLCHNCNTGWSSRLEVLAGGATQPLLDTPRVTSALAASEQRVLAAWFAKMAILNDFVDGHQAEERSRQLLEPVVREFVPPAETIVWLGALQRHRFFSHGWWRATFGPEVVHAISIADLLGVVLLDPAHVRTSANFRVNSATFVRAWPGPAEAWWPCQQRTTMDELNRMFSVRPRID